MQPQKLKLSQTQSLVLRLLHDRTVEGPLAFGRSPKRVFAIEHGRGYRR
jgi:hypothetical protein